MNDFFSINNLSLSLGGTQILRDISMDVAKGELVGIIGPNGCGKTTLLNTISGFHHNQGGRIIIEGNDVSSWAPSKRAKTYLGRSFQSVGVFKEMTLEENLILALEREGAFPWWWNFSGKYRDMMSERVEKALEEVELLAHRKSEASILSGGQLRLLELARLSLTHRPLLLVDEPTAGVAPALRNQLAEAIKSLASNHGHALLLVEHDLKFLFHIVSRVVVLVDGEVYMQGKPEDVQRDKKLREVYFGE